MKTIIIQSPTHGQREWRCIGLTPYTNRQGVDVGLATWEAPCVVCGKTFAIKTPGYVGSAEEGKSFQMTTCALHRMTRSETAKMRFTKKEARPATFDQIKANKLRLQSA